MTISQSAKIKNSHFKFFVIIAPSIRSNEEQKEDKDEKIEHIEKKKQVFELALKVVNSKY